MLLGVLIIEYIRPQDLILGLSGLKLGMIIQVLMICFVLTKLPLRISLQAKYILIFLFFMAKSIPFAYNSFTAFGITRYMAIYYIAVLLPLMNFIDSFNKLERFFRFWIVIHIVIAIIGLFRGGKGSGSFLGDENDLSLALNMVIPYAYFLVYAARSKGRKIFLLCVVCFFLITVAATLSRGGFVGLVATLLYCWYRSPKKISGIFVIGIMIACLFLFAPAKYIDEIRSIKDVSTQEDERVYSWKLGWKMFLDNPIMGAGPGNYPMKAHLYQGEEAGAQDKTGVWRRHMWGREAHSIYFTLIPELGIPGVLIFLLLLRTFYKDKAYINKVYEAMKKNGMKKLDIENTKFQRIRKMYLLSNAMEGSLVAFLTSGIFLSVLYYPHFWVLNALMVSLKIVFMQEEGQSFTKI